LRHHLEDVEHLAVHGVLLDGFAILGLQGREVTQRNPLLALDHRVFLLAGLGLS
jgi:hypothetical protein